MGDKFAQMVELLGGDVESIHKTRTTINHRPRPPPHPIINPLRTPYTGIIPQFESVALHPCDLPRYGESIGT